MTETVSINECVIYKLKEIILDERTNDGTWCMLPYDGHKIGCPKFPKCVIKRNIDFKQIIMNNYKWYAIAKKFSLMKQENKIKDMHNEWSKKKCRCVYYYQSSIKRDIKDTIKQYFGSSNKSIILDVPEASGINVYSTMAKHGLYLKANYEDIIYKIMIVGINKELIQVKLND